MSDLGTLPERHASTPPSGLQDVNSSERVFADVLCAVNGTRRSFAAVEQAAILTGSSGHLTLLSVTAVTGAGAYRGAAISPARADHILSQAARMAADADVSCDSIVDPGGPPREVVLARAASHSLLAIGAPRGSWLLNAVRDDSVSKAALGALTTSLLVARSLPGGNLGFAQRLLIASDGEEDSDQLVELAARIGGEQGSRAVLLSATGTETDAHRERIQEQGRRLEETLDRNSELRVEIADAAEAIVRTAKETNASLVVMGARRVKGLRALGSVSRRVLSEAHCSVLVIPPERLRGQ